MPVLAASRQPAHLDAQHKPDMVQAHLRQQTLEARPSFGGAAAVALIVVDDQHPLGRPAPLDGPPPQGILQGRRFPMLQNLPRRGLPNVDHCPSVPVVRLNLRRRQIPAGR